MKTINAIMNLRTDFTKEEKAESLKICKNVLDKYADGKYDLKLQTKNGDNALGIFNDIDVK